MVRSSHRQDQTSAIMISMLIDPGSPRTSNSRAAHHKNSRPSARPIRMTERTQACKQRLFVTTNRNTVLKHFNPDMIQKLRLISAMLVAVSIMLQVGALALNAGRSTNNLSSATATASIPHPRQQTYSEPLSRKHEFASNIREQDGVLDVFRGQPAIDRLPPRRPTKSNQHRAATHKAQTEQAWGSAPGESVASAMLKTFIQSNSIRAYHLDLHSYRSEAPLEGDPDFVDSRNPSHRLRCARHLSHFRLAVDSLNELDPMLDKSPIDALRLADTFGRPEAGIFEGNQFWLGSYTGCKKASLKVPSDDVVPNAATAAASTESIKGQYCIGVSQYPNWRPQDSEASLKVGLCLPETCTSSMVNDDQQLLDQVQAILRQQVGGQQAFRKLKLRSIYCLPHETSQARRPNTSGHLLILFMGAFVSLSLLATAIDYVNSRTTDPATNHLMAGQQVTRNWRQIYLESFSIIRNLDKFMQLRRPSAEATSTPQVGDTDDITSESYSRSAFLNPMAGIKCIGLIWIIAAHTFLVGPIASRNILDADDILRTVLANVYLSAHLMVDTFFTLSGLLASYFLFKDGIGKLGIRHWIVLTVHRYWRLTPIYLIAYWYSKSLGHLAGHGPLWDYKTAPNSPRLMCQQESWWEAFLHMSDYKSPKEHCVPFAWFIANGMKFWLVTPFILVLIHKSVRQGYRLVAAAIAANICVVAWLALKSNVDVHSVIQLKAESANNMLNNMGEIYTRPYSRIGTYLIGLVAGHLLHLIERKQFRFRITNNSRIFAWTLFSLTLFLLTFIVKLAGNIELDHGAEPIVFSICSALMRPIWALCTCWLVFALAHGQCRWLQVALSHPIWQVLVKLSFCAYLFQGEVIAIVSLAVSSTFKLTYADLLFLPMTIIPFVLAISFLGTILLEYPLIGIEEVLLPPRRSQKHELKPVKETQSLEEQNKPSGQMLNSDMLSDQNNVAYSKLPNSEKLKII